MIVPGFPQQATLSGPGRVAPAGVAEAMLFRASRIGGLDLFGVFREEIAGSLDWLVDFVCSEETALMFALLAAAPEEEEEVEELYSRSAVGADASDYMPE